MYESNFVFNKPYVGILTKKMLQIPSPNNNIITPGQDELIKIKN